MKSEIIDQSRDALIHLLEKTVPELLTSIQATKSEQEVYHARLSIWAARLISPRLTIAIVGRQKSGKSTLMNALVNDGTTVSPTDVNTCTSALSIVGHSNSKSSAFVHRSPMIPPDKPSIATRSDVDKGLLEQVQQVLKYVLAPTNRRQPGDSVGENYISIEVPRGELVQWVTHKENPCNYKQVVLIEILSQGRCLEKGITLIDSPGIDAADPTDTALAYSIVEEVDATIMVYSKVAGNLGKTELEFLVQRLALREQRKNQGFSTRRKVFLVQNDWEKGARELDTKYADDCNRVEQKTRETIIQEWERRQRDNSHFPAGPAPVEDIVRVNCFLANLALQNKQPDLLKESGLEKLIEVIMDYYANGRIRQSMREILAGLEDMTGGIHDSLAARLVIFQKDSEDIQHQIGNAQTHVAKLDDDAFELSVSSMTKKLAMAGEQEKNRIIKVISDELLRAKKVMHRQSMIDLKRASAEAEDTLKEAFLNALLKLDEGQSLLFEEYFKLTSKIKKFRRQCYQLHKEALSFDDNQDTLTRKYKEEIKDVSIDVSSRLMRWLRSTWFGKLVRMDLSAGVDSLLSDIDQAIKAASDITIERTTSLINEMSAERTTRLLGLHKSIHRELNEFLETLSKESHISIEKREEKELEIQQHIKSVSEIVERIRQYQKAIA